MGDFGESYVLWASAGLSMYVACTRKIMVAINSSAKGRQACKHSSHANLKGMRGESGAQVGYKNRTSQGQAGGLLRVRKNAGANQEQDEGVSRMSPKPFTINSKL